MGKIICGDNPKTRKDSGGCMDEQINNHKVRDDKNNSKIRTTVNVDNENQENKNEINDKTNSDDIFIKACKDSEFLKLINKMKNRDFERLKKMKELFSINDKGLDFKPLIYSNIIKNIDEIQDRLRYDYPWLEPRTGYYTPIRYYQNVYINEDKLPMFWRHDCIRGIHIDKTWNDKMWNDKVGDVDRIGKNSKSNDVLYFFTKHITYDEKLFFTYIYIKLDKNEYEIKSKIPVTISVDLEKEVVNLLTGKKEKIQITFDFMHHAIVHTSPSHAKSSSLYKEAYRGRGIVQAKSNISKYVIPSNHFTVHPYILNLYKKFGFNDVEEMEKQVDKYVKKIF